MGWGGFAAGLAGGLEGAGRGAASFSQILNYLMSDMRNQEQARADQDWRTQQMGMQQQQFGLDREKFAADQAYRTRQQEMQEAQANRDFSDAGGAAPEWMVSKPMAPANIAPPALKLGMAAGTTGSPIAMGGPGPKGFGAAFKAAMGGLDVPQMLQPGASLMQTEGRTPYQAKQLETESTREFQNAVREAENAQRIKEIELGHTNQMTEIGESGRQSRLTGAATATNAAAKANDPTAAEQTAAGLYTRGKGALDTLAQLLADGGGGLSAPGIGSHIQDVPFVGGLVPNAVIGEKNQQFRQAAGEMLAALLRKDSQGSITEDEWKYYGNLYVPKPGDAPGTIQQKLSAASRALEALGAQRGISPLTAPPQSRLESFRQLYEGGGP